ncbi:MAG: AmmeMemoRadiSam system protein B [Desulfobacteraceae bacterium]|nr:AmmeMemoRadiSam system protein B [Desulfobacteraceae bacterium]
MKVRKPVFSGSWYPANEKECETEINQFLSGPKDTLLRKSFWIGGIVPHAGWYYSGELACRVINLLKDEQPIDVVVLFGMHLHSGSPNFIMPEGAWQTPFGTLDVEQDLAHDLIRRFKFQKETTKLFNHDNTIELQLPFVKYLLDPSRVLALGVPPASQSLEIGQAVAQWAIEHRKHVKIIGSTDLTHYGHNYGFQPKGSGQKALNWVCEENDRRAIDAMLELAPEKVIQEGIENQNACCAGAAAAAIQAMIQLGADKAQTVAYATSYDKSPGDSFVGYTGIVMRS